MCGIVGLFDPHGGRSEALSQLVNRMSQRFQSRGPDASGEWDQSGVCLGHRRLAILDLSEAGVQPMISASGRYVISYNGEIYNYRQLQADLPECTQRGSSDTEVLLRAIEEYGVHRTLELVHGMFAFALFDQKERTLTLARDRFGEKPLFYGFCEDLFVFTSDLRALQEVPEFSGRVDRKALSLYFRHGYVPAPYSIYEGFSKLDPGSYLVFDLDGSSIKKKKYWDFESVLQRGEFFAGSKDEALEELDQHLRRVVQGQLVSDVPIGCFLSGGYDSSVVSSLCQAVSTSKVNTFTIGFEEPEFDESKFAERVAEHLGTNHSTIVVSASQILDNALEVPKVFDEPFADSSQIPTWLLAKLAKSLVTVALSGDGGDEVFCGYSRYFQHQKINSIASMVPASIRGSLSNLVEKFPVDYLPPSASLSLDRFLKLSKIAGFNSEEELYKNIMFCQADTSQLVLADPPSTQNWAKEIRYNSHRDYRRWLMARDTIDYLPDDILVKVDRSSMAVSLETRAPFLDHELVEFVWSLPIGYLAGEVSGKLLLKDLSKRYVPSELLDRPKKGFSVPLAGWLRGPLKSLGDDLLHPTKLKNEGFIDSDIVGEHWSSHAQGRRNWHHFLWFVISFELWLEANPKAH